MGRKIGSKNKKTLERELMEAVATQDEEFAIKDTTSVLDVVLGDSSSEEEEEEEGEDSTDSEWEPASPKSRLPSSSQPTKSNSSVQLTSFTQGSAAKSSSKLSPMKFAKPFKVFVIRLV